MIFWGWLDMLRYLGRFRGQHSQDERSVVSGSGIVKLLEVHFFARRIVGRMNVVPLSGQKSQSGVLHMPRTLP